MNIRAWQLLALLVVTSLGTSTAFAGGNKKLGQSCRNGGNAVCASGACDAGWGTSGTNTCVPKNGTGKENDHCTNNNHCISGICDGLEPLGGGRWKPGKCHSGAVTVSGTVINDKNQPASDVMVKVWDVNPGIDTNVLLGSGKTDSKGNFEIRGKAYSDKGDMLGAGKQPDVRVTFEVTPRYTYPVSLDDDCWKEKSWQKFCWRSIDDYLNKKIGVEANAHYTQNKKTYWQSKYGPLVQDVGKVARIWVWPARDKQLDNHSPDKPIVIERGMVKVPGNQWEIVRTNFDPSKHGFNFMNSTRDVCWGPTCKPPWDAVFRSPQALCGGFSLTALKHYINKNCDTYTKYNEIEKNGKKVLPDDLKKTLVQNQMETFFFDQYQDKGFDLGKGFDIRGLKFLEWQAKQDEPDQQTGNTIGVSTKAEWKKIRHELKNRNLPVVIGQVKFQAAAHNLVDFNGVTNNHQVLAIGYDYNPYHGSVTLYVYDPNHPGKVSEIRFNEDLFHSKMFIDYFHCNMETYPLRGFFLMTKVPAGKKPPPACK
ncbi:MAG: hypothetical protein JXA30_06075 [Deltaproteobacteria bacterium]|nr:hypothetical protein [Deltaproteobacteria bacterium]